MGKSIKIIFLNGALAVIAYLLWNNYGEYIKGRFILPQNKPVQNVVVRDVFKKSPKYKTTTKTKTSLADTNKETINIDKELAEEFGITPITEEQRQLLIQRAREAIESRLDPFGQQLALPPDSALATKDKELPPPEVNLVRKQVELVGVISTKEKDLALVNIYSADFTVDLDSTESDVEDALKKSLAMAVPNRIEVYILDPVEDWYVKTINRSTSRSDDPYLELVQGNQKFTLKVGQKVLLPSETTFQEQAEQLRALREDEERIAKELGLF